MNSKDECLIEIYDNNQKVDSEASTVAGSGHYFNSVHDNVRFPTI